MSLPYALYQSRELLPNRREFAESQFPMQPNLRLNMGTLIGEVSTAAVSELDTLTITGTPTGGTFTLTLGGQITAPIAYNATASQVAAALAALSNVGTGNVLGGGGALPGTAVTLTFQGELANLPIGTITFQNSLTGGTSPAGSIAKTTPGIAKGRFGAYASGNSDGTQVPKGILRYDITTDERGRVYVGTSLVGNPIGHGAPVYLSGFFRTGDLLNMDSTARTAFGARFTRGDATTADGEITIPGP